MKFPGYTSLLAAIGLPDTPDLEAGIAIGDLGWNYELSGGAGSANSSLVNLTAAHSTVPRLGGVLNTFEEGADPDVYVRFRKFRVSFQPTDVTELTLAMVQSFRNLQLRIRNGNGADRFYPLANAIVTRTATDIDNGTVAAAIQANNLPIDPTVWFDIAGMTFDIHMKSAKFDLWNGATAITVPGSGGQLQFWLKDAVVIDGAGITPDVKHCGCKNGANPSLIRNLAALQQLR